MITIGSKNKILLFDINTEGVEKNDLEFWFRIKDEDITYSFPGELQEDNKVRITLLPLSEMINFDYLDSSKIYEASLEVLSEGKYNVKTWEGSVQLETPPRINVKLENVQDGIKKQDTETKPTQRVEPKITTEVSEIIEEQETTKPKKTTGNKKKSLLEEVLYKNKDNSSIQERLRKIIK